MVAPSFLPRSRRRNWVLVYSKKIVGSAYGSRTRLSGLKGQRANRCTNAPLAEFYHSKNKRLDQFRPSLSYRRAKEMISRPFSSSGNCDIIANQYFQKMLAIVKRDTSKHEQNHYNRAQKFEMLDDFRVHNSSDHACPPI